MDSSTEDSKFRHKNKQKMDTAWSLPDRPLSVKEISAEANKFHYNDSISLKHWLRAADTLIRQAGCLPDWLP